MAGKIIADQIEHSTAGSLDTQYVVNGSAKAHASLDGATTPSLLGSFNVSGITDNGVGDTQYNFSSAMNDAVYSITGASNAGGASVYCFSTSTTQFRTLQRLDADGSTASDTDNSSAIFGDLA